MERRPAVVRQAHQLLDYITVSKETPFAEKSVYPSLFHCSLTALFSSVIYPQYTS